MVGCAQELVGGPIERASELILDWEPHRRGGSLVCQRPEVPVPRRRRECVGLGYDCSFRNELPGGVGRSKVSLV